MAVCERPRKDKRRSTMAETKVAGVNASTVLTDAQLQAVVPALQMQPLPQSSPLVLRWSFV
jgi:hypothetical protein